MTMPPNLENRRLITRRHFFGRTATGVGTAALASLLGKDLSAAARGDSLERPFPGLPALPHLAPKAKRVIWLFQSGGPSQMDLFDYKPQLDRWRGEDLPDSIRKGQRLTGMTSTQDSFPVVNSVFKFKRHGQSGAWISEILPETAKVIDDLCIIKSMHTEAINHDPAITFIQTGAQIAGRPSIGAWLAYGLGSESRDLPAFVVMVTQGGGGQPLYDRLWGSGFLPTQYQGVKFRSVGDPVLYLSNPKGFSAENRRAYLDALAELNRMKLEEFGDPEISTRIAQYEMAFRMQTSVPDLTNLSDEPARIFKLYGAGCPSAGNVCRQLLTGSASRRARRPLHPTFPSWLGPAWQAADGAPEAVPGDRSSLGGPDSRPQGPWHAQRHAGDLGR